MNQYSDEQLVALAVRNNQAALATLVKRYLRLVYALAYRYVVDKDEAEDVTQEVFVKVWRHLGKFDTNKVFKPWLYQITKRACLFKKRPLLQKDGGEAF
ncbi:MAG: RNA polymerase sigma factor [Candidatus Kerfeldbacteria bacterium]|nr:RNA polymerase sigma factor [Candidatus Kerfeldbacteria bacterium]